jgi:hypothetical protein
MNVKRDFNMIYTGSMILKRATLETCHLSGGLVVVIDVLRAFTTAAYLFDAGVPEILLVGEVEEALMLREQMPDGLISLDCFNFAMVVDRGNRMRLIKG